MSDPGGRPQEFPIWAARRYLLGRSGLWPGRRLKGKEGAADAIHMLGKVQVDPVSILARSHDLVLHSRVAGYAPAQLDELLYRDRRFFDYGAHLDIYPIEMLPLWRLHMRRRATDRRQVEVATKYPEVVQEVLDLVRERGPLGARDVTGRPVDGYRARHDAGLALYHHWLTGRFMTAGRRGIERLYDLLERVAPAELQGEMGEAQTEAAMAQEVARRAVLVTPQAWREGFSYAIHRPVSPEEAATRLAGLEAEGLVARVRVEGSNRDLFLPREELALLDEVAGGGVPPGWLVAAEGKGEAVLLSPLDNVLDRRQLKPFFAFEYVWEIYKRPAEVRYGRYVTPILLGDRLVGRLSPRFEQAGRTLRIDGIWLEDEREATKEELHIGLALGLRRLQTFLGAGNLALAGAVPGELRQAVEGALRAV